MDEQRVLDRLNEYIANEYTKSGASAWDGMRSDGDRECCLAMKSVYYELVKVKRIILEDMAEYHMSLDEESKQAGYNQERVKTIEKESGKSLAKVYADFLERGKE